jgi:hypothetical protein
MSSFSINISRVAQKAFLFLRLKLLFKVSFVYKNCKVSLKLLRFVEKEIQSKGFEDYLQLK